MLVTLQGCLSNNNPSHDNNSSHHNNPSNPSDHSHEQGAHGVVSSQLTKDQQFIQKLVELKQRDPVKDAQQAIAKGTLQLIARAGRRLNTPGVDASKYPDRKQKCGVRYKDDFSDLLYGPHHRRYYSALHTYAEKYNKVILQACYQF